MTTQDLRDLIARELRQWRTAAARTFTDPRNRRCFVTDRARSLRMMADAHAPADRATRIALARATHAAVFAGAIPEADTCRALAARAKAQR